MIRIKVRFLNNYHIKPIKVELGYNVMKGSEYSVLLQMSVVVTREHKITVRSKKLTSTTEYLTL